jgi:hypothetical protein
MQSRSPAGAGEDLRRLVANVLSCCASELRNRYRHGHDACRSSRALDFLLRGRVRFDGGNGFETGIRAEASFEDTLSPPGPTDVTT